MIEHSVMPKVISSLICTQSEGRLIMAFPLHSIIKITILLRVFSYSLWVDIQVGFLQVSWLFFFIMLHLPSLCNAVPTCIVFYFVSFADDFPLIFLFLVLNTFTCFLLHVFCKKLPPCAFPAFKIYFYNLSNRLGHWQESCRHSAGRSI